MVDKRVIDTIIAEAVGGGEQGMLAVANVINNRAAKSGKDPLDIVKAPKQFEGYSNPGPGVSGALKDPALRARVEQMWNGVVNATLPDPTNGGTMFRAKYVTPYWDAAENKNGTANIGGNVFYLGNKPRPISPEVPPRRPDTPSMPTAVAAIQNAVTAPGSNPTSPVTSYAPAGQPILSAPPVARPAAPGTPFPLPSQNAAPVSNYPTVKAYDVTGKTWGDFRPPETQIAQRARLAPLQAGVDALAASRRAAQVAPPSTSGLTTRKVQSVPIDPRTGSIASATPPVNLQASLDQYAANRRRATAPTTPVDPRAVPATPSAPALQAALDRVAANRRVASTADPVPAQGTLARDNPGNASWIANLPTPRPIAPVTMNVAEAARPFVPVPGGIIRTGQGQAGTVQMPANYRPTIADNLPRPPVSATDSWRPYRAPAVPQRLTPSPPGMPSPGAVPGFGMAEVEQVGLPLSGYVNPNTGRRVTGEPLPASVPLPRPRPAMPGAPVPRQPATSVAALGPQPAPIPGLAASDLPANGFRGDPTSLIAQTSGPGPLFLAWINEQSLRGNNRPILRAMAGIPQAPRGNNRGLFASLFGNRPAPQGNRVASSVSVTNPMSVSPGGQSYYTNSTDGPTEIQRMLYGLGNNTI